VSLETEKLAQTADKSRAVAQAIEVLRKRVDRFGVAEPVIIPQGENRILIQLPGLSEAEKESARVTLQKAAFLEFRIVHPESDTLVQQDIVEPGYELLIEKSKRKGVERQRAYLVKKGAEKGLTGKFVERSGVYPDPISGSPKITLKFDSDGAKLFGDITRENVGHQLAIVLDGELHSAPNINEPILGGNCEISGGFDIAEAYELANVLQNPLEAPVHIEQESSVDPSLGRDSVQSGVKAALIGTVAVAVFMLVYYMLAGVVANLALMLNIVILIGVMCSVGTTLTLPGIAGIVLTIGMAVDANVLIYERIREELAAGKSIRGAVAAGYDKAFGTIFDSNLTTLISSVILIYMGTGPVKGFGVTLTIGITVSMFTALVVTRMIFDFLLDKNLIRNLPMLHLVRGSFDFMKYAKIAFAVSWTLILVGNTWGLMRGREALGVEFRGGDSLGLRFEKKVEVEAIRATVAGLKIGDSSIQYQRDIASNRETLQVTTVMDSGAKVEEALKAKFPEAKFERVSLDRVGAVVGREIQKSALVAGLLALFGILVYVAFRYEFSFAVGAVVAIIHDILMTLGLFFLSGRELSAPIVAALLTIIGFSINDTIVIFDRIREDLKLGIRGTFTEVMNKALNQTLSRTIITSGTVFLATLALYIFGGGVVNDFSFCFLAGIVTGTYSSIYIASALVLWWHKGERPKMGSTTTNIEAEVDNPNSVKAAAKA
jgi:SecD/SecF fusion protein